MGVQDKRGLLRPVGVVCQRYGRYHGIVFQGNPADSRNIYFPFGDEIGEIVEDNEKVNVRFRGVITPRIRTEKDNLF
jgi:hypothetical protein